MELKEKKILVTGGAGAIGMNLVQRLLREQPAAIIVLDNLSSGRRENVVRDPLVTFIEGDIRDDNLLSGVFLSHHPEVIFHLAAQFANQNSVDHPLTDLDTNIGGTIRLLEQARLSGVERFFYTSSSCVYKPSASELDDSLPPLADETPYAISKGVAERYCFYYHQHFGLPVTVARLFNCYGPGELPGKYRNVIPNFIAWALAGQALPITGTGEEERTFTFVDDLVDVCCDLVKNDKAVGETVNIGSDQRVKIKDLAEVINRLCGNATGLEYKPRRNWDKVSVRRPLLNKLATLSGNMPATSISDGLKKTIAWAREWADDFRIPPED